MKTREICVHPRSSAASNRSAWTSLDRFGCQRFCDRNALDELLRQIVPRLKIRRAIVGDPDLAVTVLPNQDLERQIDRDRGRGNHEGSSGFRIAEYQKLCRPHM